MKGTEGQEEKSSCAVLRREVREEKGQLEGLGFNRIFKIQGELCT